MTRKKSIELQTEKHLHLPFVRVPFSFEMDGWNAMMKHVEKWMKKNKTKKIKRIIVNPSDIEIII